MAARCLPFFLIFLFMQSPAWAARLVAILDTGVDIAHPRLKNWIWSNPGESGVDRSGRDRARNGLDDDHNGFIDDVHGWDFADQSGDVSDKTGHGTHIAGLIQDRLAENPEAHKGVRFVVLKYFSDAKTSVAKRTGNAFAQALRYAVTLRVDVINISGGGYQFHPEEKLLLEEAARKNILIVAAAGNKKAGGRDRNFYPAAYDLPNVVSVAATDSGGRLLPTSNLNPLRVNTLERGENLLSCLPQGAFGIKSGSSQATALVTGRLVEKMLQAVTMVSNNLNNP